MSGSMHPATPAAVAVVLAMAAATPAPAQTATITMSHDDADGMILPGETVHVTMRISWTPAIQLAGFAGQIRIDPHAPGLDGSISNRESRFTAGFLVNLGTVVGDDVAGIDVASVPGFFTPMVAPPFGFWNGFDAFEHDWTAPATLGTYDIKFLPSPLRPNVMVYPIISSPNPAEAITTYIGTSIRVVPAPAGVMALALGAAGRSRRPRP